MLKLILEDTRLGMAEIDADAIVHVIANDISAICLAGKDAENQIAFPVPERQTGCINIRRRIIHPIRGIHLKVVPGVSLLTLVVIIGIAKCHDKIPPFVLGITYIVGGYVLLKQTQ